MSRKLLISICFLVFIPISQGFGFNEKLGIRMRTSRIQPLKGSMNDSTKMSDYLNPGVSYGIGICHIISDFYTIEFGLDVGWMSVKREWREDPDSEPVFFFPRFYFSNMIRLPMNRVVPYLRMGASIVPWKFTIDGPKGESSLFEGEKFQKMSFNLHAGIGLEIRLTSWFALYCEGNWDYLFCRDQFFFGKNFTEQGILGLGGGILLYLIH